MLVKYWHDLLKILKLQSVGRQMLIAFLISLGFWSERWKWKAVSRNHWSVTSFCLWQVITRFLFSSCENYPSLPTSASSRLHFHFDLSVVYQHLAWGFHKHSQALRFLFERTDLNWLTREREQTMSEQHVVLIYYCPAFVTITHHFCLLSQTHVLITILCWRLTEFWYAYNIYKIFHLFDDPLNENRKFDCLEKYISSTNLTIWGIIHICSNGAGQGE